MTEFGQLKQGKSPVRVSHEARLSDLAKIGPPSTLEGGPKDPCLIDPHTTLFLDVLAWCADNRRLFRERKIVMIGAYGD